MKNKIFFAKLNAFLHDPVDKPFTLMQGESHESRAKKLAWFLGIEIDQEIVRGADMIASAMERSVLPAGASRDRRLQVKFLDVPEIVHPLSGKRLCFNRETMPALEEVKKVAEDAMACVPDTVKNNPQALYLFLWRNLLPALQRESSVELSRLWSVAPADTRVPDHSIFEHLKVTSACFNSVYEREDRLLKNQCAFLLFTIGPVQSFIYQARKTQDLYWGSFILSYLNWIAIKGVIEKYGPDAVIFPELYDQPLVDCWLKFEKQIPIVNDRSDEIQVPTLPNRFLAIVPDANITSLASELEKSVRQEFKTIASLILQIKHLPKPDNFDSQVDHFLEIYWVGVPWFSDESTNNKDWQNMLDRLKTYFPDEKTAKAGGMLEWLQAHGEYLPNIGTAYSFLYDFTEKALGSCKNMRKFKQNTEQGIKCSICGQRNVLFCRNNYGRYVRQGAVKLPAGFPPKYLQNGEGLCGVCFTKRCAELYFQEAYPKANLEAGFPSTAEIALAVFKENLLQKKKDDFKIYVSGVQRVFGKENVPVVSFLPHTQRKMGGAIKSIENIDAEWFIEDNLTPALIKKQLSLDKDIEPAKINEIKELLKKLSGEDKSTRYYAIIMLDGDNMGKWVSGGFAPYFKDIYHQDVWRNLPEDFKGKLAGQKRLMTPALHAAISTALKNYSLRFVRRVVEEEYPGKLVYAGGDDVLAFVNLNCLCKVMVKLRAAFSGHLDKELNVDFNTEATGYVDFGNELALTMGEKATASMGVCIAHYKTPLGEVLKQARFMEKRAKDTEKNKDALAIALLKHSGEIIETVFKWKYSWTPAEGTAGFLQQLVDVLSRQEFSDKFAYILRNEFSRLVSQV